jgi:hypothetical protein
MRVLLLVALGVGCVAAWPGGKKDNEEPKMPKGKVREGAFLLVCMFCMIVERRIGGGEQPTHTRNAEDHVSVQLALCLEHNVRARRV